MKLEVRLFALAREAAGMERVTLEVPDHAQVGDLRAALSSRFPNMASLVPRLLVACGNEYADERMVLCPTQEIACFPAVSGG